MTFIEEMIRALPEEDRVRFNESLAAVLESYEWLAHRGLQDSSEYSVKVVLYREMFERDFSRLRTED